MDLGVTGGAGGGVGDRLGAVEVLGVVVVFLVFGITPEVEAVGDDGVVLGFEELADEVDKEGRAALAEVLALGGLTIVGDAGGGAGGASGILAEGALALTGCDGCGCSETYLSAVSIVYQLNLNSGTVSGSPVRSW